jgi:hypothetical protein
MAQSGLDKPIPSYKIKYRYSVVLLNFGSSCPLHFAMLSIIQRGDRAPAALSEGGSDGAGTVE